MLGTVSNLVIYKFKTIAWVTQQSTMWLLSWETYFLTHSLNKSGLSSKEKEGSKRNLNR